MKEASTNRHTESPATDSQPSSRVPSKTLCENAAAIAYRIDKDNAALPVREYCDLMSYIVRCAAQFTAADEELIEDAGCVEVEWYLAVDSFRYLLTDAGRLLDDDELRELARYSVRTNYGAGARAEVQHAC